MMTTTMMRTTTNRRFAPSLTFRIFVQSKLYHLKSIPVDFFVSFCYPMPCMFSYRLCAPLRLPTHRDACVALPRFSYTLIRRRASSSRVRKKESSLCSRG